MEQEYDFILNSTELCRICLDINCSDLKSLYQCDINDHGDIWSVPKMFEYVTNIHLANNDGMPQNICIKCETTMVEAFIFKQKSKKSHDLLKGFIKSSKHEVESNIIQVERKSQSTQTHYCDDMKIIESNCQSFECIEEDEEFEDGTPIIECKQQDRKSSENFDEEEFENRKELSEENMFICEVCCEKISKSIQQVHSNEHNRIMPLLLSSMEFFRCSRCLMVFPHCDLLFEHVNTEELCERSTELKKEDAYTDYQYSIDMSNELEIRLISTCRNIGSSTFSCTLCILDFEEYVGFCEHFRKIHLTNLKTYPEYIRSYLAHKCGVCKKTFKSLSLCLAHSYFHQISYACAINNCNHVTNAFDSLYIHLVREHSNNYCKYCSFQAKSKVDLKKHQRSLCSAREMKCEHCGKLFYKKSTLNMHLRTHTNDRKYGCSICSKAFLQKNDLSNHMRTHTGEKPYKCEICTARFKTIGQRTGHLATHTNKHNFECEFCHNRFKSARILNGHKKIHFESERKFHCVCGKKFIRKYHLTCHMRTHTGKKP